jgi:hypothetical protein
LLGDTAEEAGAISARRFPETPLSTDRFDNFLSVAKEASQLGAFCSGRAIFRAADRVADIHTSTEVLALSVG